MNDTPKSAKSAATARDTTPESFTDEERGAMKERARELRTSARRGQRGKADGETELLVKRLAGFTPEEGAEILVRLDPVRAKELLDALPPANWRDFAEAYARATSASSKSP